MKQRMARGFTLIEILVVLSIIGILTAILTANFTAARQDARNKAVRAELKEVQLAIELYKAQHGRYPEAEPSCDATVNLPAPGYIHANSNGTPACGTTPYIAGLVPDFIAALPTRADSGNPSCNFNYKTNTNGTWYKLTAVNCIVAASQAEGIQTTDEMARCPDNGVCILSGGICQATSAGYYQSLAVYQGSSADVCK